MPSQALCKRERERASERKQEVMFASVWYAKKMGRRFINNVRRAKRHRRMMVGAGGGASPLTNQPRRNTPVSVRRRGLIPDR